MSPRENTPKILLFSVFFVLIVATPAWAYVDPNATGLISQLAAPVLLVAATALTFLRRQIGSAFRWFTSLFTGKK
jgi:hypothetical protein